MSKTVIKTFDAAITTQRVLDWLIKTKTLRLLHRFEHVATLVNQAGDVSAIHDETVPLTPFSIQISPTQFSNILWNTPLSATADQPCVRIGATTIQLSFTPRWRPIPPWGQFEPSMLPPFIEAPSGDIPALTLRLLHQLKRREAAGVTQMAQALAGRGAGLTPAGDDVLVGIIFALTALGWESHWGDLISQTAQARTSTLSAAFLECARQGEAIAPWHAVLAGEQGAIEQIIGVGHSSGRDALFGFIQSIKILS